MKAYVHSNGCVPNQLLGHKIEDSLLKAGHAVLTGAVAHRDADVIVFNACGYSAAQIEESFRSLCWLIKDKKRATKVILTGCFLGIVDLENEGIDCSLVALTGLSRILGLEGDIDDLAISGVLNEDPTYGPSSFHVITSRGCLGHCSYCAIPKARGKLVSRPEQSIVAEIHMATLSGFHTFHLWGDDLGAYGKDVHSSYTKLLDQIGSAIGSRNDVALYLHRLNAQWIIGQFGELQRSLRSGLVKFIHSPIQSGSNRILRLMNRKYTREQLLEYFCALKTGYPQLQLATDVMIGFPTEDNTDFHDTLDLLERLDFREVRAFRYSGVPRTRAFYYGGQIDPETKHRREVSLIRRGLLKSGCGVAR